MDNMNDMLKILTEPLIIPDALPAKYQRVLHLYRSWSDTHAQCGLARRPTQEVDPELEGTWPKCATCKRLTF